MASGFSLVKSHMNLVAVMSNALETLEEANEEMFKGDCRMAQRLRNWVVFLHGHDGEISFMVNHGLLMRTEAPFLGVFDRTFKRWNKDSQTALSTMLRAPFAGIGCASLTDLGAAVRRFLHQRRFHRTAQRRPPRISS